MEKELGVFVVKVRVEVFDALGVERGGASDDAVHFIALAEKEFGEVASVLSSNSSDQKFHSVFPLCELGLIY